MLILYEFLKMWQNYQCLINNVSSILDGQITAADILSDPIPKKKRKQEDPKEELREIKALKPEEIESVDVSCSLETKYV